MDNFYFTVRVDFDPAGILNSLLSYFIISLLCLVFCLKKSKYNLKKNIYMKSKNNPNEFLKITSRMNYIMLLFVCLFIYLVSVYL